MGYSSSVVQSIVQEIQESFLRENSERNRQYWAQLIIDRDINLEKLLPLLTAEKKVATQFIWMVGGLCELKPEIITPHVSYFYAQRKEVKITNYNRSLAKMFSFAGIPVELEGLAAEELFQWLNDPKVQVQTRSYVMYALFRLSEKYPELKTELKAVLEEQLDQHSLAFKKRAMNLLEKLRSV